VWPRGGASRPAGRRAPSVQGRGQPVPPGLRAHHQPRRTTVRRTKLWPPNQPWWPPQKPRWPQKPPRPKPPWPQPQPRPKPPWWPQPPRPKPPWWPQPPWPPPQPWPPHSGGATCMGPTTAGTGAAGAALAAGVAPKIIAPATAPAPIAPAAMRRAEASEYDMMVAPSYLVTDTQNVKSCSLDNHKLLQ